MSDPTRNGEASAFGFTGERIDRYGDVESYFVPGLTKREYIATQAMAALIQAESDLVRAEMIAGMTFDGLDRAEFFAKLTAKAALTYADALLNELSASQNVSPSEGDDNHE